MDKAKYLHEKLNKDNTGKIGHWDYIAWNDMFSCSLCKSDYYGTSKECPNCHATME